MRRSMVFIAGPVLAVCAAVLAACVGQRPDAPPAAAVTPPTEWREGSLSSCPSVKADPECANHVSTGEQTAKWWQGFGDPVLSAVVEKALANNVDIAIAALRVEEARGLFGIAHGQLLPSAELDAGGKRERFLN